MGKTKPGSKGKLRRKPTFDFVSPRSLVDCADLLRLQAGRTTNPVLRDKTAYQLAVETEPVDDDTYWFTLEWNAIKQPFVPRLPFPYASVHGYLKRWEDNTTYVTGRARISIFNALIWGAVAFLWLVLIVWSLDDFHFGRLVFMVQGVLFTLSCFLTFRKLRQQLIDTVKGYLDVANPTSARPRVWYQGATRRNRSRRFSRRVRSIPYSSQPEAINEFDQQHEQAQNSHQADL